jgi:hypothetical protein
VTSQLGKSLVKDGRYEHVLVQECSVRSSPGTHPVASTNKFGSGAQAHTHSNLSTTGDVYTS